MAAALETCREFVAGERKLVFLYGERGLGKTHLLTASVMEWRRAGNFAQFWEVSELLAFLRSTFDRDGDEPSLDYEVRMLSSPDFMLALDEMGAHNPTAWAEEQLFRILNTRYANYAPTILTANVAIKEIDARIRSRFREGFVYCEGEDVRGREG